jgi:hypothetical protein
MEREVKCKIKKGVEPSRKEKIKILALILFFLIAIEVWVHLTGIWFLRIIYIAPFAVGFISGIKKGLQEKKD